MSTIFFRHFAAKLLTDAESLLDIEPDEEFALDLSTLDSQINVYNPLTWDYNIYFNLKEDKVPTVDIWLHNDDEPNLLGTLPISIIMNNDLEWKVILRQIKESKQ